MKDPVTGFDYPDEWVKKCSSPELLRLAEEGLGVLTSTGTVLRRGYTTGTTAAAACKVCHSFSFRGCDIGSSSSPLRTCSICPGLRRQPGLPRAKNIPEIIMTT